MAQPLPEGISKAQFDEALIKLGEVVGPEWVFADSGGSLDSYKDAFSPVAEAEHRPSAAVAPNSVEEVQAIVRLANEYDLELSPISTGKNYAYGGPAPRKNGAIVLDLKRMNRILEVNEESAYALLEPGVTYIQLYEYLKENNIKLWIDCAAPGWGGVVGNTMDRGAGYTPYGDHVVMQCGMEVVMADGDVIRTGMGAMENSSSWQLFKYGYGPYLDGMFTQSNLGICTKMGVWLMPEPPGYRPFMITVPNEDDLYQLIETLRPLKINMVIPNAAFAVHMVYEAGVQAQKHKYFTGKGPMPPSAMKKMGADLGLGAWNVWGALYGPPPIMDVQWQAIEGAFRQIPGVKFYFEGDRSDTAWTYRSNLMQGIPNMTEFSLMNWDGSDGHASFSPISPVTGRDAVKQFELVREITNRYGFDYVGEFVIGWREIHHIVWMLYHRAKPEEMGRLQTCFKELIDAAAAAGYGEYRTHLAFMDQVKSTYNAFDNGLWKVNDRLKAELDPNGILAPGKSGIWPQK